VARGWATVARAVLWRAAGARGRAADDEGAGGALAALTARGGSVRADVAAGRRQPKLCGRRLPGFQPPGQHAMAGTASSAASVQAAWTCRLPATSDRPAGWPGVWPRPRQICQRARERWPLPYLRRLGFLHDSSAHRQ
jgi:hypothetical protein